MKKIDQTGKAKTTSVCSMQRKRHGRIRHIRTKVAVAASVAVLAALLASPVQAEEGWAFTVGTGVFGGNVYVGSDDSYTVLMPTASATYARGGHSFSISLLEGLGYSYASSEYGLVGSLKLNAGSQRKAEEYAALPFGIKDVQHSERTRQLLEGTPDVATPVVVSATLQYPTSVGVFGASAAYHPTTVDYSASGSGDTFRNGLLVSVNYAKELPITDRLSVAGMFALDLMDGEYADAWYSVERETEALDTFDAGFGLRDVQLALHIAYKLSERVGVALDLAHMTLLGDAEKSPYTVEREQNSFFASVSAAF